MEIGYYTICSVAKFDGTHWSGKIAPYRNARMLDESRFNLYKLIHKYARYQINQVAQLAGSTDFSNVKEREYFTSLFEKLFNFLGDHANREETYIHPLLKEIKCELLNTIEATHKKLDRFSEDLKNDLRAAQTPNDFYSLYLDFVQFQSAYFNHLDDEERKLMPELHRNFSDDRLLTANGEILRTMPPDMAVDITRGMLPVINHGERVEMFTGMKTSMPPELFADICNLASKVLSKDQTLKLFQAVGIKD